jgi:hypothetical protein
MNNLNNLNNPLIHWVYYIKLEKRYRYRTLHPSATDLAQAIVAFTVEDNIDVYFHH